MYIPVSLLIRSKDTTQALVSFKKYMLPPLPYLGRSRGHIFFEWNKCLWDTIIYLVYTSISPLFFDVAWYLDITIKIDVLTYFHPFVAWYSGYHHYCRQKHSKVTTDIPLIQNEILHTEKWKSTFFNEYQESYDIQYDIKQCLNIRCGWLTKGTTI